MLARHDGSTCRFDQVRAQVELLVDEGISSEEWQ
jgi:hypothetical protein